MSQLNEGLTARAASKFYFKDTMSKETLRAYASRAVTSWLVLENLEPDPIFEEDLRMTRRIGAKYLGRAASFSWGGDLTKDRVDEHFRLAKEIAAKVHKADPEIILQAGVFEIVYKGTVNSTPIPDWVCKDFGIQPKKRNFKYENIVFPEGHEMGPGFWGTGKNSAVPNIRNLETQMYFYYNICRYIDAGFEAVHLGQAEKMMEYKNITNAVEWDRVTTLARAYAKKHARRGVVLFDAHSDINSGGMKVGNRLILDIQAAALVPNETKKENGAWKCEVVDYTQNWLSWVGRSAGGRHPLGFDIDANITILEFDNYGGNGKPGVATPKAFYVWGYDDITWFALQPEWYRNQFLKETDAYLKTHRLDKEGKQVYFLQPCLRRVLVEKQTMTYKPGKDFNVDFVLDYLTAEKTRYEFDEKNGVFRLTVTKDYRANRQSDGCPNGSNQEDTIREIFLGKNAPEDPELLKVVLPEAYRNTDNPADGSTSVPKGGSSQGGGTSSRSPASSPVPAPASSRPSSAPTQSEESEGAVAAPIDDSSFETSAPSAATDAPPENKPRKLSPLWPILGATIVIAAGGSAAFFLRRKKSE